MITPLLTLPNGERDSLPSNVQIVFEIENLNSATPATVSSWGIICFSHDSISTSDIIENQIYLWKTISLISSSHYLSSEYLDIPTKSMISQCKEFWDDKHQFNTLQLEFSSPLFSFFWLLSAHRILHFRKNLNTFFSIKAVLHSVF
jgi:hypothetical protein